MKIDTDQAVMTGLIALMLALITVGTYFAIKGQGEWEAWCHAQGGHVDSSTAFGTGVATGSNGQPTVVTTSSTTYYCLTSDGRILDVN